MDYNAAGAGPFQDGYHGQQDQVEEEYTIDDPVKSNSSFQKNIKQISIANPKQSSGISNQRSARNHDRSGAYADTHADASATFGRRTYKNLANTRKLRNGGRDMNSRAVADEGEHSTSSLNN